MKKRIAKRAVRAADLRGSLRAWWLVTSRRLQTSTSRRAALASVRRGRALLREFLARAEALGASARPARRVA